MRLLEYEAKNILNQYQIKTPPGQVIVSADELTWTARPMVLKAQIPLGGRGKAGGVRETTDPDQAKNEAGRLLSTYLRGYRPRKILAEEKVDLVQEFYLGIVYDTVAKAPAAIFSREGGVDIEELAAVSPEKVSRGYFSVRSRLPQYRAREIIADTDISGRQLLGLAEVLSRLADVFLDYDAVVAEINPLALTKDGRLVALDAHIEIDADALFRHPDLAELEKQPDRVESGSTATEFERRAAAIDGLDHRGVAGRVIEFDGSLGLIIGGGGASLTAFDAVKAHGGRPANYCEIGGNPSVFKVKELTKLILSKPGVDKIAVIMNVVSNTRVDLVARGIIKGILESGRSPAETVAVFRVPGAWEEEGFKILSKYGVTYCDRRVSIDQAAGRAVESLQSSRQVK